MKDPERCLVPVLLVFISFFIGTVALYAQQTHELSSNSYVKEFKLAGPFHQEGLAEDDFTDLLEIEFIEDERNFGVGPDKVKTVLAKAGRNNLIDFYKILGDSAIALAYAQFQVSAPAQTEALFLVSAADGEKIYVEGKNVHTSFGGRGMNSGFYTTLHEGNNNVVIKVPNRDWNWKLSVRILDEEKAREYLDKADEESEYLQFLHSKLQVKTGANPDPRFLPGKFPDLDFDKPLLAKKHLGGSYSITTRWFDGDLVEMQYPKKPGRYAYYAEIEGANGIRLKKSATLFCSDDWRGQFQRLDASLGYIPINDIQESTWTAHQEAIGGYTGFLMQYSMMLQEGAALLAFVDQMNKKQLEPGPINTPLIIDGDYHAQ